MNSIKAPKKCHVGFEKRTRCHYVASDVIFLHFRDFDVIFGSTEAKVREIDQWYMQLSLIGKVHVFFLLITSKLLYEKPKGSHM